MSVARLLVDSSARDRGAHPTANGVVYRLPAPVTAVTDVELESLTMTNPAYTVNETNKRFAVYESLAHERVDGSYGGTTDADGELLLRDGLPSYVRIRVTAALPVGSPLAGRAVRVVTLQFSVNGVAGFDVRLVEGGTENVTMDFTAFPNDFKPLATMPDGHVVKFFRDASVMTLPAAGETAVLQDVVVRLWLAGDAPEVTWGLCWFAADDGGGGDDFSLGACVTLTAAPAFAGGTSSVSQRLRAVAVPEGSHTTSTITSFVSSAIDAPGSGLLQEKAGAYTCTYSTRTCTFTVAQASGGRSTNANQWFSLVFGSVPALYELALRAAPGGAGTGLAWALGRRRVAWTATRTATQEALAAAATAAVAALDPGLVVATRWDAGTSTLRAYFPGITTAQPFPTPQVVYQTPRDATTETVVPATYASVRRVYAPIPLDNGAARLLGFDNRAYRSAPFPPGTSFPTAAAVAAPFLPDLTPTSYIVMGIPQLATADTFLTPVTEEEGRSSLRHLLESQDARPTADRFAVLPIPTTAGAGSDVVLLPGVNTAAAARAFPRPVTVSELRLDFYRPDGAPLNFRGTNYAAVFRFKRAPAAASAASAAAAVAPAAAAADW